MPPCHLWGWIAQNLQSTSNWVAGRLNTWCHSFTDWCTVQWWHHIHTWLPPPQRLSNQNIVASIGCSVILMWRVSNRTWYCGCQTEGFDLSVSKPVKEGSDVIKPKHEQPQPSVKDKISPFLITTLFLWYFGYFANFLNTRSCFVNCFYNFSNDFLVVG